MPADLEDDTRQIHNDLTSLGVELLSWLQSESPDEVKSKFTMPQDEMMHE